MKAYLSTGAFRSHSLNDAITFSLEHGIDRIELSSGVNYQSNLLDSVLETKDKIQYLVHNYFPPPSRPFVLNLSASDSFELQQSLDLCRTAIDLAADLGAPFYSVHSGFAFRLDPNLLGDPEGQSQIPDEAYISYDVAYQTFGENIKLLADYAESRNVGLLFENNVVSSVHLNKLERKALLMVSAEEIIQFLLDVDHQNVGLLLDVGHLNVTAKTFGFSRDEFIKKVSPYIGAFHLSDNNGEEDNNLPFNENSWFCPLLGDFQNIPFVIEAYNLTWPQIQHQYGVLDSVLG